MMHKQLQMLLPKNEKKNIFSFHIYKSTQNYIHQKSK